MHKNTMRNENHWLHIFSRPSIIVFRFRLNSINDLALVTISLPFLVLKYRWAKSKPFDIAADKGTLDQFHRWNFQIRIPILLASRLAYNAKQKPDNRIVKLCMLRNSLLFFQKPFEWVWEMKPRIGKTECGFVKKSPKKRRWGYFNIRYPIQTREIINHRTKRTL